MQKRWILIGSVAYFGAAFVDYRWIRWLGIPFYVVSMALHGDGDAAGRRRSTA